jgi:TolB-like protein
VDGPDLRPRKKEMSESSNPENPSRKSFPLWILGLFVVVLVMGYSAFQIVRARGNDVSLPPGFSITTGEDSGPAAGPEPSGRRSQSLADLIAATVSTDSSSFQASIAILPLVNRTGDSLLDTLGNGITEEVITRLSRIRGLKVISLLSVQEMEGLDLTVDEVADTLGVDHLLQGTAFPYQDAARIEVRLLEVAGESEIWSNDYSLDRTNQMRAVEEISNEVSAALMEGVPSLSLRSPFQNSESSGYVEYLAGTRLINSRTWNGILRAIEAFQSAIEQDSTLAPAFAGLSSAYALSITYRYDIGVDAYAAAGLALSAASKAVELDPDLAEGYAARGYISSVALAPAQPVLEDFSRALDLQPNAPNVPAWYANLLVREGYYDQALVMARRAVSLDPLSPARRTGLAYEALRAKDYGLAIQEARTARSLSAEVILPRSIQALALLLSGRAEECLDLDLGPHAGLRAICLHDVGRFDQAEAITDSLRVVLRSGRHVHPGVTNVIAAGDLAAYLAWTGSPDRAMHWIHRAYAMSPSGIDPRVLNSGVFEQVLANAEMRREVSGIQDRIWARVQRELTEGEFELNRGIR